MSQNPTSKQPAALSQENRRKQAFELIQNDLPTFARHCLKIRDKSGNLVPFVFNKAQMYLHQELEAQKKQLGFVRAVILKARQLGMSTYVAARFFHQTILRRGTTTFILSHESKSTANLFDMVKRFIDYLPEGMSPGLDTSNKNQLKFSGIESEYTVGTAGNEDIGRSMTIKQLHMSEAGFYEHTDSLETGLMQATADRAGTEIIIESTANGIGNFFHSRAMKAMAGVSLDKMIFLPWYWDADYRLPAPPGFSPDEDEQRQMSMFNLDLDQIYWRRMKINSSSGGAWKFAQENPATPDEAFLMSGETFYSKEKIIAARKCTNRSPNAPKIGGLDCGRNNDRSVFTIRQGRAIIHYEVHKDLRADGREPTQQLVYLAAKIIDRHGLDKLFIDFGYGHGVVDGLITLGYKKIVMGINFQQEPMDKIRFLNKRAEMHGLFRDWLEEGEVSIPDDDIFCFDLLLIPKEKETPTYRMFLPKKEEIKTKAKVSPDINDSAILTFAMPVAKRFNEDDPTPRPRKEIARKGSSELTTIARLKEK